MAISQLSKVIQNLRKATLQDGVGLSDGQLLDHFIEQRDEAAFAALVHRHGPVVWGVCHRVLGHHHDAEDAFQATFLVLARKAASIRPRQMVANWLFGVAHRTALHARTITEKRRTREKQVLTMPEPESAQQDPWRNLAPRIDQELAALPDKYRVAIVLCDLEGKTGKEVARQLKVPEGTLASRLRTARMMLAKRLSGHGLMLSGGALAAVLSQNAASASAPAAVVSSTIKAAPLFATGQAAAPSMVSAKVAALTEGGVKAMLITKLQTVMAVLVGVALAFGIGGFGMHLFRDSPLTMAQGQEQIDAPKAPQGNQTDKPKTEAAKKDADTIKAERKMFEGTWQFASYEVDGQKLTIADVEEKIVRVKMIRAAQEQGTKLPIGNIGGVFLVYDAEGAWKLQTEDGTIVEEGNSEIDPAKKPKSIDTTGTIRGTKQAQTKRGIYEFINEDTCRVCLANGKERAADFTTKPESGKTLWVMQRVKKEPANTDARLHGRWEVIASKGNIDKATWLSNAETISFSKASQLRSEWIPSAMMIESKDGRILVLEYVAKESQKPQGIDLIPDGIWGGKGKATFPSIYQIDGDTLKICVSLPRKERPKDFEPTEDVGQVLVVLRRTPEPKKLKPVSWSEGGSYRWRGVYDAVKEGDKTIVYLTAPHDRLTRIRLTDNWAQIILKDAPKYDGRVLDGHSRKEVEPLDLFLLANPAAEAPKLDDKARADLKRMQGRWYTGKTVISGKFETGGKFEIDGEAQDHIGSLLDIQGDTFGLRYGKAAWGGTVTLDATAQTIDLTITSIGAGASNTTNTWRGKKWQGIYAFNGDTLKLCFGRERPQEFRTQKGKDQELHILKRIAEGSPADPPPPKKPEEPKKQKDKSEGAEKPAAKPYLKQYTDGSVEALGTLQIADKILTDFKKVSDQQTTGVALDYGNKTQTEPFLGSAELIERALGLHGKTVIVTGDMKVVLINTISGIDLPCVLPPHRKIIMLTSLKAVESGEGSK